MLSQYFFCPHSGTSPFQKLAPDAAWSGWGDGTGCLSSVPQDAAAPAPWPPGLQPCDRPSCSPVGGGPALLLCPLMVMVLVAVNPPPSSPDGEGKSKDQKRAQTWGQGKEKVAGRRV